MQLTPDIIAALFVGGVLIALAIGAMIVAMKIKPKG